MKSRIVGIGQRAAGDDGVGLLILERLRSMTLDEDIELHLAAESTALLSLLETPNPVFLLDAVVGITPGTVKLFSPNAFQDSTTTPLSSHGINVIDAIEIAKIVSPETISPRIQLIGVGITPPREKRYELSPEVEAAIPEAIRLLLDTIRGL
jgi:hydrogenase maturation protease